MVEPGDTSARVQKFAPVQRIAPPVQKVAWRFVVWLALWAFMVVGVLAAARWATITSHGQPQALPVAFSGPSAERDSIVAAAARAGGMPEPLAIAVSHLENWGGDSAARNPVSGATGLMQVIPGLWADSFRTECGAGDLTGRRRNACVGVRVAMIYFRLCGDWECALRRYGGTWCAAADGFETCLAKRRRGDLYVMAIMRRLYRTDLSPARDGVAVGQGWRR